MSEQAGDVFQPPFLDHAELDAIYDEAVEAAEAGVDTRTLGEIWQRFDSGLRAHLSREEITLFPVHEVKHPTEVAELRATHDWIRQRLDALGLEVDLHLLRSHQVVELTERLRAHAEREDETLYRWASVASPPPPRRLGWFERLLERLGAGRSAGL